MSVPSLESNPPAGPRALTRRVLLVLAGLAAAGQAITAARATPPEVVPDGDPNAGVQIIRGLPDASPEDDTPVPPRTGADLERAAKSGTLTAAELATLSERTDLDAARLRAAHCTLSGDDPGLISALEDWHRADPTDPEPPFKLALLSQTQGDSEATVHWADIALQRTDTFPQRVRERQTLMLAAIAARAANRQGKADLARVYAKRYVAIALHEKSRVPEDIRDLALDEKLKAPAR